MVHELGKAYQFFDIRKFYKGVNREPWYVIHRERAVLAVCANEALNLECLSDPVQIWVGAEKDVAAWGVILSQTKEVPLYVRRKAPADDAPSGYEFRGLHQILPRTHTDAELAAARARVSRELSRIVFLQPAGTPAPEVPQKPA